MDAAVLPQFHFQLSRRLRLQCGLGAHLHARTLAALGGMRLVLGRQHPPTADPAEVVAATRRGWRACNFSPVALALASGTSRGDLAWPPALTTVDLRTGLALTVTTSPDGASLVGAVGFADDNGVQSRSSFESGIVFHRERRAVALALAAEPGQR